MLSLLKACTVVKVLGSCLQGEAMTGHCRFRARKQAGLATIRRLPSAAAPCGASETVAEGRLLLYAAPLSCPEEGLQEIHSDPEYPSKISRGFRC